jgi:hypothetical protein
VAQRKGLSFDTCSAVAAVRRFTTPGLIIHDTHDRLIPHAVGEEMAANWAGAQFISTSRLGHRRGLGNTQVIGHIMGYLAGEAGMATAVPSGHTLHKYHTGPLQRVTLGNWGRATAV